MFRPKTAMPSGGEEDTPPLTPLTDTARTSNMTPSCIHPPSYVVVRVCIVRAYDAATVEESRSRRRSGSRRAHGLRRAMLLVSGRMSRETFRPRTDRCWLLGLSFYLSDICLPRFITRDENESYSCVLLRQSLRFGPVSVKMFPLRSDQGLFRLPR